MNEMDALRTFRTGASPPSAEVATRARARLLAALDGAAPTRARGWPRRLALAVSLSVGVAVAVLATGALLGDTPGVVDRAEAAITGGDRILHVVVRVTDASGSTRGEAWIRTNGKGGHSISLSGERGADCTSTPTQLRCYDAVANVIDVYRYDPAAVRGARDDLPGYRADDPESLAIALRSGYARSLGETQVAGRAVHAIRLAVPLIAADGTATPRFSEDASPILYVDRETYLPVAQRFPDAASTTVYETYEFLPDDAAHARLLEVRARDGARVVRHPVGEGPRS